MNIKQIPQKRIGNGGAQAHRARIQTIKKHLPKDWRERVCKIAPQYDSLKGASRLNNVFNLLATDEFLTPIMEEISRKHRAQNQQKIAV